jgi:hypothetical protein
MLAKRTALQGIYERAEWLTVEGVSVELIWVKSHANSRGNKLADRAADEAVGDQIKHLEEGGSELDTRSRRLMTMADVPTTWKDMGPDWAKEWLSRANNYNPEDGQQPQHPKMAYTDIDISPEGLSATNGLPYNDEERESKRQPEVDYPNNQRGFFLPNLSRYGNTTIEQAIEGLRLQSDLLDLQISSLERFIAREATKKTIAIHRAELHQLDSQREQVLRELQAQLAELAVQEADEVKEGATVGEEESDELGKGIEIEGQILDGISIAQGCV